MLVFHTDAISGDGNLFWCVSFYLPSWSRHPVCSLLQLLIIRLRRWASGVTREKLSGEIWAKKAADHTMWPATHCGCKFTIGIHLWRSVLGVMLRGDVFAWREYKTEKKLCIIQYHQLSLRHKIYFNADSFWSKVQLIREQKNRTHQHFINKGNFRV